MRLLPLLLIPVVLAPVLLFVLWRPAPSYQSTATIWVSNPSAIEATTAAADDKDTPAQVHLQVLNDLLLTRSFRDEVAEAAGMVDGAAVRSLPPDRADATWRAAAEQVATSVSASADGVNLLTVRGKRGTPEEARKLVEATVAKLRARLEQEESRVSKVTGAYFEQQLAVAREELQRRQAAFTAYVEQRPNPNQAALNDVTYNSLLSKVRVQEDLITTLQNQSQKASFEAASSSQNLAARFNIVDAPSLPALRLGPTTAERGAYALAAGLLGGFVALAYLYLVFRTDHTIRSSEDLQGLPVPLLGYLPNVSTPWYRRRRGQPEVSARRLAAAIVGGRAGEQRNR